METESTQSPLRKPDWLRVRLGHGKAFTHVQDVIRSGNLHTVCEEALCPNRGECWQHGRATLMILGDLCTRGCTFCGVTSKCPAPPDREEPKRVAEAVKAMGLTDVVITSVTRDDLEDGGAAIWAETIERIRDAVPGIGIEVLVPDFAGDRAAIDHVLHVRPEVFGHNLETVPRLYCVARPHADYHRSLAVLKQGHVAGLIVKTGIMVGIGEEAAEVEAVMRDAVAAGVSIFYVGQYLQPSREHLAVERYVEPKEFEQYQARGLALGFRVVVSGPLVRSSYHSETQAEFVNSEKRGGGQLQES